MTRASINKERQQKWANDLITRSNRFTAYMFLGRGKHDKREASSLKAIRKVGRDMLEEYGNSNYGRDVIIYAVATEAELTIFVETIRK